MSIEMGRTKKSRRVLVAFSKCITFILFSTTTIQCQPEITNYDQPTFVSPSPATATPIYVYPGGTNIIWTQPVWTEPVWTTPISENYSNEPSILPREIMKFNLNSFAPSPTKNEFSQNPSRVDMSYYPTEMQTINDIQSDIPSEIQSEGSSLVPTDLSSDMSSWVVSDAPSLDPPFMMTGVQQNTSVTVPFRSRSIQPYGVPTKKPIRPTKKPSHSPSSSSSPSSTPSVSPSLSALPSTSPSGNPTSLPSDMPSFLPTYSPSQYPSSIPTQAPSYLPTVMPSSTPTLSCHDVADYRSPLNNFTCSNHVQTDCMQWKFLGLEPDDVEDLINSCPISCMIDCGSLVRFDSNISYRMSNVDNFLAPESVTVLQAASVEYFTNFISQKEPDGRFSLYQTELLSQTIISKTNPRFRRLQTGNTDLAISVAFRGFVIDIDTETIEQYLIEGIDSEGYVNALRSSGDKTYLFVEITTDLNSTSGNTPIHKHATKDRSPGVVAASVIAAILIFTFLGGLFVYKKHKKNKKYMHDDKDEDSNVNSPQSSVRSPLMGVFSFDSVIRLVSSAGNPRSQSDGSSTSKGLSSASESKHSTKIKPEELNVVKVEPSSSEESEHPLTGIIPPMIVYDLSNGERLETENVGDKRKRKRKSIVPAIHIEASDSFRLSLCDDNNVTLDESMYDGITGPLQRRQERYMGSSSVDSSMNDEGSVTPSIGNEESKSDILSIRKSVSEGNTQRSQVRNKLSAFNLRRKLSWIGNENFESPPHRGVSPSRHSESDLTELSEEVRDFEQESGVMNKSNDPGSKFMKSIKNFSVRRIRRLPSIGEDISTLLSEGGCGIAGYKTTPTGKNDRLPGPDMKVFIFWAPARGKLGLLIECIENIGPIVTQVKDYSPLLGNVQTGDRIVEIDGVSTLAMSVSDVLSTLSVKQSSRRAAKLRLVIWRMIGIGSEDGDASDRVLHSGFGSSGSFLSEPNDHQREQIDSRNTVSKSEDSSTDQLHRFY